MFQSTHPRGVRLTGTRESAARLLFQSTHPRGVRLYRLELEAGIKKVSIHAPAWGATDEDLALAVGGLVFQSTHPRGVRRPK